MALNSTQTGSKRFHSHLNPEINVTPFVDVMLVLLVIFMVTAPMMTAGVNVDLPQSKAKALPGNDEPLIITVSSKGKIYLQKSQIELEELTPKLSAVVGEKRDTRIFVRGDQAVDYGRIMQVIGEVNSAGFAKVSLVSETGGSTKLARGK